MFSLSIIKSICWTTFFLFFQLALYAQQETYPCAASEMQRLLFEKDPTLLQRQLALDQTIHQHIERQNARPELRNSAVFTIPVVVHIIHQNGSENISDALVQSAIQHLNDAFAHQGYYGTAGKGTNIPIQFCLAQRTPNNQATNGITRDVSSLTTMEMETDDAALKNLNSWDPRQYVNIWVVRDINSKAHGSGVAGYAYYASAHGASFDGIVCEARYFGNNPANDVVLIHEVGHYLNLYHTFEGGCTNNNCELEGDRVCDTPPDQAKHTGCVYNSCNTDTDDTRSVNPLKTDANDLTENYLDYSPFSCQHAFTPGQSARMLAALQTVRASLLDSPGCLPPCTQPIAADMVVPPNLIVGTPVTFTFNGSGATRYEWKLNGTVFSSQQNPGYTFTQAGIYKLEVLASNNDANCVGRKQTIVNVLCNASADFSPKLNQVKFGDQVTFTSTGTGINTYEWAVNGTVMGTGKSYTHSFNSNTDYHIQLKVSNANCSATTIQSIAVQGPCDNLAQQYSYEYNLTSSYKKYILAKNGDMMAAGPIAYSAAGSVIMKWNANAELEWIKKEIDPSWKAWNVVPLSDRNWVYIKTHKDSTAWVELVKIDPQGQLIWNRRMKMDFTSSTEFTVISQEKATGFLIFFDHSLIQFDDAGNVIWAKTARNGIFNAATQRSDGKIVAIYKDSSNQTSLLLLDEKGNLLKQNTLDLTIGNDFSEIHAVPNNRCMIKFLGQGFITLLQIDVDLSAVWGKKIMSLSLRTDIVCSTQGDVLLPSFEIPGGIKASAFDTQGNYLWSISFRMLPIGDRSFGVPYLNGWKLFGPGTLPKAPTKEAHLNIPDTKLPEGCFIDTAPQIKFTDLKPVFSTGTLILNDFLTKEIPSSPIVYENISSTRTTECRSANPCPEICDNDIDDNGDGLIDCADPTCKCEECRQLPDGIITALDSIQCLGDSLKVYLKVCNKGQGILRATTPIAFYKTDPSNSNASPLAGLKTLGINLLPDSCTSRNFVIKAPGSNPIFIVLNDDYRRPRPYTLERYLSEQHPECNYLNNKFQFTYNSPQTPKLDLGPDQLTCANSVTLLRAPTGFAHYRWFDGSTDSTFTAFSPGTYWIDAWDACGNKYSDSIHLKLQALGDVELGSDHNICAGDTLHLSVAGFTQLKWWPAIGLNCDTCKSIIAKPDTTTRYYMTARRGNCFAGDSVLITVNAQPKVDLGPDRAFCSDTTWQLIGPLVPSLSYRWNMGATTPSINVNQTGAYALEVRNAAGCNARDTAKLTFISNFSFDLGMDTTLCTGKSIRLPLKSIDATAYRWSTGEQSASIEIREPGLYILEGTKDNCSWRDSINITLEDCNRFAVYVPNVMSTTSAVNAQFHPFFSTQTELVTYQFEIYDRWGEMVFRSQDVQESWDGSKNGRWCNQGVYVWTLRVRYREDGQEKEAFKVGEVLLLR